MKRRHSTIAAGYKKNEIKKIAEAIQRYKVIGVADMTGMPSPQLQKMRTTLRGSVDILMSKGRLIRLAFEQLDGKVNGIKEFKEYVRGMPSLIFTNDNPFKLASMLNKSKSSAPAKPGQVAPADIWVKAGQTSFPPGPLLGELGSVGLKAFVDQGKIAIREDKLLVKQGEAVNEKTAGVLSRLGIQPMEIGINLVATLENGEILTKKVLCIDTQDYFKRFVIAQKDAFGLSLGIAYPTKENIMVLLQKAERELIALEKSGNLKADGNIAEKLAEADAGAEAVMEKIEETIHAPEKDFVKGEEEVAQEVLKKLQDQKIREKRT